MILRVAAPAATVILISAIAVSHHRVGHSYANGNCEIDADGKLTGACEASNGQGSCVMNKPAADSPACPAGVVPAHSRAPACGPKGRKLASADHTCFFITP